MTQPPDPDRTPPAWTPPAWAPPPPRGSAPQNSPAPQPHQQPYGPAHQEPPAQPYQQPSYQQPSYQQPAQPYEQTPYEQPYDQPIQPAQYQPGYAQPPAQRKSGKRIGLIAGAVVVILAIALTAYFVVSRNSSSAKGGAASPQAAATDLATAAAKQDVDGVLALIDPAESRSLGALISAVRSKVGPSGAIQASGVPLPYLSMSLTDLRVTTDPVRPDLAFATVESGQLTATADPRKAPPGMTNGQTKPSTAHADVAQALNGTRIGMVKVYGKWYFSPTTTALEAIRRNRGLPQPSFDQSHPATGGSSPQDAVTGLINAINSRDLKTAAGYVSGKEIPALPYYYDVFASQVSQEQGRMAVEIGGLDLSVEDMTNGLKKVDINGATVNAGHGRTASYSQGCVSNGQQKKCLNTGAAQLVGISKPFVVVEQNNGKWQISPIATVVEYLREMVTNGSLNAFYRKAHLEALAPTTATIAVGKSATVQLNDAGFAHVTVTGAPNQCFAADSSSGGTSVRNGAYTDKCDQDALPASGKADLIVFGGDGYRKGSVLVTVRAK